MPKIRATKSLAAHNRREYFSESRSSLSNTMSVKDFQTISKLKQQEQALMQTVYGASNAALPMTHQSNRD